ncbi:hypothetical protein, variant [Phytophthora nicotianae CJ01A1]|uniref:Uncharacterized protein n=4 Tax=Phytophthora nicotianae TaxID=4792 RepID=W3A2W1_PHYNI|nr:hypothetical protein L915_01539 [Phytophthora nicotianae]ETO84483.1 hypothetical protein F444_01625 [Phytophthora nicotianae P1976]ETO99738.1 hypothetical protein F441_22841 [Phytophthora nicotianae CJ01A1]ETP53560.1 hypothetical protein F442_01561 [Phytophthora nicotianae P10297]ETK95547.1 hypothetical protein, variant [Phytophthora nicotianae]
MKNRRLLKLGMECAMKVYTKSTPNTSSIPLTRGTSTRLYSTEAHEVSKSITLQPEVVPLSASLCGSLDLKLGRLDEALYFFDEAMKSMKGVRPISLSCAIGVAVQDEMGTCFICRMQLESVEQMYNNSIREYEKCQGRHALPPPNKRKAEALDRLNAAIVAVFYRYAMLMALTNRPGEISSLRKQALRILRNSPNLRSQEASLIEEFDGYVEKLATLTPLHRYVEVEFALRETRWEKRHRPL